MDLQRDPQETNPWLLSTHLQDAHVDAYEQSRLLWCKPLNLDEDDEDGEDAMVVAHEQWVNPEEELIANNSCFRRTTSRATPTEQLPSARTYQTIQLSVQEFSKPSMSIRSQTCELYSSRKPHQPPAGRSLTSWTPTASLLASQVRSTSSEQQKVVRKPGLLKRLTGRSGTPLRRTNSGSSTKEMVIAHK
uniref:P4 n=1 Tax=parsley polerovirus TaxID=3238334 RepID=A0AB39A5F0_9VIRU